MQPAEQQRNPVRLGIVTGMPSEARSLTERPVPFGGHVDLEEGVLIYLSGIGPKRARAAAHALLNKGATALLSWGIAGGLTSGLTPGSLVIPKTVIAEDQTSFDTDPVWHARLSRRLADQLELHTRPIAESRVVLVRPEEKEALFKRTGAVAVDMESAAVALAARAVQVPFMAVRAIADPADMALPPTAVRVFGASGRVELPRALKAIMGRPLDLFPLLRLGLHLRSATRTLSTVARLSGNNFLVEAEESDIIP